MDGLLEGVESRGAALLNNLNLFGWASKALSLIKEFLLLSLAFRIFRNYCFMCSHNPIVGFNSYLQIVAGSRI